MKSYIAVLGLVAAFENSATEAHGGSYSSSCGGWHGGRRRLYRPNRHYDYHMRARTDAIDLVSEILSVPSYSTNSLFRQHQGQLARRVEQHSSVPRYAISESKDGSLVELTMEVPGVVAKYLSVEIEDGSILRVRGSRFIHESGSVTNAEFDQSFQLAKDIDFENIEVTLSSGILTITAPKKETVVKRVRLQIKETISGEKGFTLPIKQKKDDSSAG